MGWNSTGKFGIHSGRTLRRYSTRKNVVLDNVNATRRSEFAVVKQLNYGNRAQNVDPKAVEFDFDDGGLPLEKDSPIYSLNKRKRWLLPELLKESINERFDDESDDFFIRETKDVTKKRMKGKKRKADAKLRVSLVERYSSAEALRYQPDCIGVTSSAPLDSPHPERKPKKKYSHVGDLKSKVSGEDVEVYYEFLSPFPKEAWPSNRQFRNCRRNSIDEVVGSKSKKKGKGRRNKCYLHGGHRDESFEGLDEWGSFDACDDDVLLENDSESVLNSECTFPIGAYIRDAIQAKNMKNTAEINLENKEPASTRPHPIVYGKGQAIYTENDEIPINSSSSETKENNSNQTGSKYEPLTKDKKIKINLLAEDIACDSLSSKFGSNYIEGDISPRKFIIKADINEAQPNNDIHDHLCLLFEVSDAPKNQNTVEATVTFSLAKPELIPNTLNSKLESEMNRFQNGSSLTVKTIIESFMEIISTQIKTTPKSVSPKKSTMNVPVEFIQQICKWESEVCDLKKATLYALGSQERIDVAVSCESGNSSRGNGKLFCEICYVEEADVQCIDQSDFTRLLYCSHQFCNGCWSLYLESCIKTGQSHISCPHFNCKTTIPEPLIWSHTNSKLYQHYRKITLQNLISTNPQLRNCPTADCPHLAYIEGLDKNQSNSIPVLCKCGLVWCFACQNQAHWPASCKEMDVFREEFKHHEEYVKMLRLPGSVSSVHVKRCPVCCHPIEKGFGCNHMSCLCGREFCWECLTPWDGHDWSSCARETKDLEEVELTVNYGSARYDKYCKIASRNGLERNGKNFFAFKHLKEKAKRVENAHEFVTHNPKTSTCKFVQSYIEKNIASMVEDIFCFKNVAHFVLENTAAYMAITKTTKLVKSLERNMELLDFIIQRCNEVLLEPAVLLKEGKLESVQELLKRGEQLVWNIDRLVQANRKE